MVTTLASSVNCLTKLLVITAAYRIFLSVRKFTLTDVIRLASGSFFSDRTLFIRLGKATSLLIGCSLI